jgi:hypothetical protein
MPIINEYDKIKPVIDFIKNLKFAFDLLKIPGGRIPDCSTARLKNLNDMVAAVANDSSGALRIAARHKEKGVLQEIVVERDEARVIQSNILLQKKELIDPNSMKYEGVLMYLYQSSVDNAKIGKKGSEKGVVERVDNVPRPIIYASDDAASRIKAEIFRPDGNPYKKLFVVNVDVEFVSGVPKAYRILNVSDVLDMDD